MVVVEATQVKRESTYKNIIQEYRYKKQQINELLTSLTSKEVYKWFVSDMKKIINCKKVKADGATPVRQNDLLVLLDLVQGRPEPTPSNRSEEEMNMDGGVDSEVNNNLCKGDKQHQVTSVII